MILGSTACVLLYALYPESTQKLAGALPSLFSALRSIAPSGGLGVTKVPSLPLVPPERRAETILPAEERVLTLTSLDAILYDMKEAKEGVREGESVQPALQLKKIEAQGEVIERERETPAPPGMVS